MIHINCFQPKHMATYVVGARKPSQETFLLSTQNIRGLLVGEPKSRIVQKHTFFAPERYMAGILYTDSLNSA